MTIADVETASVVIEQLSEPGASAVPLGDLTVLADIDGEATVRDPWGTLTGLGVSLGSMRSSVPWEGGHLVASEQGLTLIDEGVQPTTLADLLPAIPDRMEAQGDRLWFVSEMGLHWMEDEQIRSATLDDAVPTGFATGVLGGDDVVWTASGHTVVALSPSGDQLDIVEFSELFDEVDDVATLADGTVWAAVNGWLAVRDSDGSWSRVDVGSPVRQLVGSQAAAMWARTDDGWVVLSGGIWRSVDLEGETTGQVDGLGRMFVASENGVARVGFDRPLALLDAPEGGLLLVPQTLHAVPAVIDEVTAVTAQFVGPSTFEVPVDLDDDFAMVLDPDLYPDGAYTLEVTASYGSESSTATLPLILGDFTPTWTTHVGPLNADRCQGCHTADATILHLHTKELWEDNFDLILEQIAAEPPIMPPADRLQLSPLEIFLIESWGPDFEL